MIAARWLEPDTIEQLRKLVIAGNPHAIRALCRLDDYRRAVARSPQRRHAQRSFERHAGRAIDGPDAAKRRRR